MDKIWVVGDLHGCYDTFIALIKKLPEDAKICLVGDLIDRGPKSREIVQYVIDNNIDCVMGNHEVMMIEEPVYWGLNGGHETLLSYSDALVRFDYKHLDTETFEEHKEWMRNLPLYKEYPNIKDENGRHLVVSHSLCFKLWKYRDVEDKHKQEIFKKEILWTRNFHGIRDVPDIFNIIGHTPQKYTPSTTKIYANVDTGCCFKDHEDHGVLSALSFPSMEAIKQVNIDKY